MTVFLVFLATAGSSPRSMFNEVPTSRQVGRVPVKNTGIPSLAARRCSKVDQRQKMSKEPLLHSHQPCQNGVLPDHSKALYHVPHEVPF